MPFAATFGRNQEKGKNLIAKKTPAPKSQGKIFYPSALVECVVPIESALFQNK